MVTLFFFTKNFTKMFLLALIHNKLRLLIKRGTERNGTEWNKLIKHGTEQLSRHKVLPCTHSPLKLAHANFLCTRRGLLTHLAAGNGWKADYSIPANIRTIYKCDATAQ